ncbi:MAG: hypothetical protein ABDH66_08575 [Bacteroidia bacterium]
MRFWLWCTAFLSSCQPNLPPPPISQDTTVAIIQEIYAARAYLLARNLTPVATDSLLSIHTHHLLRRYGIDSTRWEALRKYCTKHPQYWQILLEQALSTRD